MKVMRTGEVLCWKDGIPGSNAPPHPSEVQISHTGRLTAKFSWVACRGDVEASN